MKAKTVPPPSNSFVLEKKRGMTENTRQWQKLNAWLSQSRYFNQGHSRTIMKKTAIAGAVIMCASTFCRPYNKAIAGHK
jgi:hypothetical protein